MNPRLIVIAAGLFVALAGYVCLAPDQFEFLRLPDGFASLGMERIVTGLALMLLGFIGALSEVWGPARRRRAQPFDFGDDNAAAIREPRAHRPLVLNEGPPLLEPVPERYRRVEPARPDDAVQAPPEP